MSTYLYYSVKLLSHIIILYVFVFNILIEHSDIVSLEKRRFNDAL